MRLQLYPPLSSTPTSPPQGGRLGAVCFHRDGKPNPVYVQSSGGGKNRRIAPMPAGVSISGCVSIANAVMLLRRDLSARRSPPLRGRCHAVTEGGNFPHSKVPPHLRRNARRMRSAMTEAELKLWNELRAHRLMGLGFRRQVPIGRFIADFACPEHKLIVEVDGSQHAENYPRPGANKLSRTAGMEGRSLLERRRAQRHRQCLHAYPEIGCEARR